MWVHTRSLFLPGLCFLLPPKVKIMLPREQQECVGDKGELEATAQAWHSGNVAAELGSLSCTFVWSSSLPPARLLSLFPSLTAHPTFLNKSRPDHLRTYILCLHGRAPLPASCNCQQQSWKIQTSEAALRTATSAPDKTQKALNPQSWMHYKNNVAEMKIVPS